VVKVYRALPAPAVFPTFATPTSALRRHVLRADPAGSFGLILLCRLRRDGV